MEDSNESYERGYRDGYRDGIADKYWPKQAVQAVQSAK